MQEKLVPIEHIQPYENNPRVNDHAVDAIAASIAEYGFLQPIVVDSDNTIIAGETRWKAACKLGLKEVPVKVADHLTPARVKAYRIADNKLGEFSEWDSERLGQEFQELMDMDLDLSLLGFNDEEIQRMIEGLPDLEDGFSESDADPDSSEAANTQATIGEYRFEIDREDYLSWIEEIKHKVGFEKSKVIAELKKRLKLP